MTGSGTDSTLTVPPGEHVWITAIRFPDGYDWELDTCAVEGTVWMDLYCDGKLYRSLPAGASIHPDMHRFTKGHLYADYSTDTETVVLCDGDECLRFSGREALRGFLVREDGIHTLGQDRDGEGVTYRIDGREAFRSSVGTVVGDPDRRAGALMEDDGQLYYCYSQEGRAGKEFRVMREAGQLRVLNTNGAVYDVRVAGGKVYWVQSSRRILSLMEDGLARTLRLNAGENVRSCRIVPGPDGVFVGIHTVGSSKDRSFIHSSSGQVYDLGEDSLLDILCDGKGAGWLLGSPEGTPLRFVQSGGETLMLPPGGYLAARDCALFHDGSLYLALSGRAGTPGHFIAGDEVTEIPFNGYFTSITIE